MFSDLFRLKDWALIGPVGVGSLLLGLWGFLESGHSIGDAIIQTIGLIRGAGTYAYGKAPLQLVIAQYMLPATALFGGAKLLLSNMRRDVRVALAHRARNHIIVCGLGDAGMQIVDSMNRAGKSVVVVTRDGTGVNALACERLGVPVLNGDATQPGLLKLAGLLRADSVIVTTGSDAQNLEIGLCAAEYLVAQSRCEVKLLIEVRSDWMLDSLIHHRTASLGGSHVEVQLFNTAIDAARLLLFSPSFQSMQSSANDSSRPHVVLAGFGDSNREVARRAICSNFALPGIRAALTVLTQNAADEESRFRVRDAALASLADFSFSACKFSIDRPDIWPEMEHLLAQRAADFLVVALDDDDDSLFVALQFRACLDRIDQLTVPVFVRLKEQFKLGTFLKQVESHALLPNRLVPFGSRQQLTSPDILLGHELDSLARAGHNLYARSGGFGDNAPASVPWSHLPERFKASNRAQADHMAIALGAIGYRIVAGAAQVELSPQELEQLGEIEHYRWCIERRSAGWTYGEVRDDVLKRNPMLKDWRDLPEKDRYWNREMARRIPEILGQVRQGLMKERTLSASRIVQGPDAVPQIAHSLTIIRVDPLADSELSAAERVCMNSSTRVRFVWRGGAHLAEIERRLLKYPSVAHAFEGWTR